MSSERRGDHSALQKVQVICRTCEITESFYSNLSVQRFKSRHEGHDVVGGGENTSQPRTVEVAPPKSAEVRLIPPKESAQEEDRGTMLSKVIVDLVVFPALGDSVFRARGLKDDLEEAFVATSRFENGAKVRAMLESREYIDFQNGGVRYVWDPSSIEFEGGSREMLGMPRGSEPEMDVAPQEPEPRETPLALDESTVAETNEMLFGEPRRRDTEQEVADSVFPSIEEPPAEVEIIDPLPQPQPEPITPELIPEPSPEIFEEPSPEPEAPEIAAPQEELEARPEEKVEEKAKEKAVEVPHLEAPSRMVEEEEYLLVSKSWYIQGGDKNKAEAVRVSKVLKAFRWRVEPEFTIGVILDDILSVVTSKNEISREVISGIEGAGYRLTAVSVDQGKPVAWFKKTAPTEPTGQQPQSA